MKQDKKKAISQLTSDLFAEIFWMSIFFFGVFLFLEEAKAGFVSYYMNLNTIFVVMLLSGILMAAFNTKTTKQSAGFTQQIILVVIGLVLTGFVFWQASGIGVYQYIVSVVFFLGYLTFVLFDRMNKTNNHSV